MFQIHAANKVRKRKKKEDDRSRKDLWVIPSSPLPVGAPAGRGQQSIAVAMLGAVRTQM